MTSDTISGTAYWETVQQELPGTVERARDSVGEAADLIAAALRDKGVIQVFGTGHSQALAMEVAGRAGGLVPTNQLSIRDRVLFGHEDPEEALDPFAERDPAVAAKVLDLAEIHPADIFIIASQSGGNGAIVEMARLVKERGHKVIALTSVAHSSRITARHPSGQRLFEVADVVLDNGAPFGDAALQLPDGTGVCALSTISGAVLVQMTVAETVARLLAAGVTPPLYQSANVPGSDERNARLEAEYAGRIRRTA
ncbi:sugar isomerase domain-containing protein [Streptomyces sp. TS71-3]|uniref:sugar isomerase domain-containing protein n=1 Tax=Streptomyces sp. TS71-3 TaxID=2733862 RepID=UPI001B2D5671|nr:SIS domain-containing protein [Streptomyces sp. TS71-3]GHJ35726.1 UPF0309 protein [Streptomyces sp. TS71-3]